MNLKELRDFIKALPSHVELRFGIGEPFSWRGIYSEVAFPITEPMSKEEILKNINKAYNNTFEGYKGGYYEYSDSTPIHFEEYPSDYTADQYTLDKIKKIKNNYVEDVEMKLISLIVEE